jgi:ABC-2 type transport system ATP-binding protein
VPVLFSSHQLDLVERLCDAVVILADGKVVADGPVDELRRRKAGHQVRIVVEPDAGWLRDVPGLTVLDVDGASAVVDLDGTVDRRALLVEAMEHGDVRELTPLSPRLSDLYREVLA